MASSKSLKPQLVVGEIKMWSISTPPSGWLICDGSAISQNNYSKLYQLIGVTYGNPGGGNFNIPDLRGNVPVGRHAEDSDFVNIAAKGGEKANTLSSGNGSLPAHSHTASSSTSSNHRHSNHTGTASGLNSIPQGTGSSRTVSENFHTHPDDTTDNSIGAHSHTLTVADNSGAASQAHNNIQPYQVINYIIKH